MQILQPSRVEHRYVQRLVAPPDEVFPLLCPVRELEWAEGWDPLRVYSASGLVERDCAFVTSDDGVESTWVVTRHEPERHRLEMVKFTPGSLVTRLTITLEPDDDGCRAEVRYVFVATNEAGRAAVAERDETTWIEFMREWERSLKDHLTSGGEGSACRRYRRSNR